MSNVGGYTVFPKVSSTQFVVKNTAPNGKTVKIFNYPILNGSTRDLLSIPGISEADIRHSLLKGELANKIKAHEVVVIGSDIDLIQFNSEQLSFLQAAGISSGLKAGSAQTQDIELAGIKNGSNTLFTLSTGDKFLYDANNKLTLYINGVRQAYTENFMVAESGGPGTGYDTIVIVDPPLAEDDLFADYFKV